MFVLFPFSRSINRIMGAEIHNPSNKSLRICWSFVSASPSFVQGTLAVLQYGTLQMPSKMFASSSGRTRNSTYYFQDCEHFPAHCSVQIFKTGWSTTHGCIRFTPPDMHQQWGQAHASDSSVFERWISRYSSDAHVMNFFMFILLYFAQLLPCRFSNLSHRSLLSLDRNRYFVPELFL